MKKIITIVAMVLLISIVSFAAIGCTSVEYSVGKEVVELASQVDILTELTSKTADIGILDSTLAGYYLTSSSYADSLTILDIELLEESDSYGIAGRKEADSTMYQINTALLALANNGTVDTIATEYGLTETVIIDKDYVLGEDTSTDSDWDKIVAAGELVVGYTVFAPIAYTDANGDFVGFDTDLAKAVGTYLGITIKFVEIEWASKELELQSYNIDLIWNGMTITDEREDSMNISIPYLSNEQVAICRTEDAYLYTSLDSFADAIIAIESGSSAARVAYVIED
ncbi:MAG: transporter substrate-binding domain-containing protein [Bacillota bacterium]